MGMPVRYGASPEAGNCPEQGYSEVEAEEEGFVRVIVFRGCNRADNQEFRAGAGLLKQQAFYGDASAQVNSALTVAAKGGIRRAVEVIANEANGIAVGLGGEKL